jgi:uncharacterized membrane protein YfbV (UPF0208 family)
MARKDKMTNSVLLNDELLGFNQQQNLLQLGRNSIRDNPKKILLAGGIAIVVVTAAIIFWPIVATVVISLTTLQLAAVIVTGLATMVLAFNGLMISKEITAEPAQPKFTSFYRRVRSLFSSIVDNQSATVNTNPRPATVSPPQQQPATDLPPPQQLGATDLPTPRPGNS